MSGPLEKPEIVRQVPISTGQNAEYMDMIRAKRKPKPFKYEKILDMVRQHNLPLIEQGYPPQPAIIARFNRGGRAKQGRDARDWSSRIRRWLDEKHPTEKWVINIRAQKDSWYVMELYATFKGTQTIEEHEADVTRRLDKVAKMVQASKDQWARMTPEARATRLAKQQASRRQNPPRGQKKK